MKAIAICLFALMIYLADFQTFLTGNDATSNVNLPISILKYGEFTIDADKFPYLFINWMDLDDYSLRKIPNDYAQTLRKIRPDLSPFVHRKVSSYCLLPTKIDSKHYASTFGIGVALAALPFFSAVAAYDIKLFNQAKIRWYTGKVTAAIFIALSVMMMFLILNLYCSTPVSHLLTLAYAFGTCVYSVASQTLWQQTPVLFFISLGLYLFLKTAFARKRVFTSAGFFYSLSCGFALGFAALCRPTSFILVLVFSLYFMYFSRWKWASFMLGVFPFFATQLFYNHLVFGSMFDFGQLEAGRTIAYEKTGIANVWQMNFIESIPGMLFSPSRGLFVFSPFFLFSVWGAWIVFKNAKWKSLRWIVPIPLVLFLIQASWFDWWGGWSWGYRTLMETCPFLVLLMAPIFEGKIQSWKLTSLGVFLSWAFYLQILGAYTYNFTWSSRFCNIDKVYCRSRLWSLVDNEIYYYTSDLDRQRKIKLRNVHNWSR